MNTKRTLQSSQIFSLALTCFILFHSGCQTIDTRQPTPLLPGCQPPANVASARQLPGETIRQNAPDVIRSNLRPDCQPAESMNRPVEMSLHDGCDSYLIPDCQLVDSMDRPAEMARHDGCDSYLISDCQYSESVGRIPAEMDAHDGDRFYSISDYRPSDSLAQRPNEDEESAGPFLLVEPTVDSNSVWLNYNPQCQESHISIVSNDACSDTKANHVSLIQQQDLAEPSPLYSTSNQDKYLLVGNDKENLIRGNPIARPLPREPMEPPQSNSAVPERQVLRSHYADSSETANAVVVSLSDGIATDSSAVEPIQSSWSDNKPMAQVSGMEVFNDPRSAYPQTMPVAQPRQQWMPTASDRIDLKAENPSMVDRPTEQNRSANYQSFAWTKTIWKQKVAKARQVESSGDTEGAIELYEAMLNQPGTPAVVYHRLGVLYDQSAQYDQAQRMFQEALAMDPDNPDLLCDIGFRNHLFGNWKRAAYWYEVALNVDPKHTRSHNHMGVLLADRGNAELATHHFKAAKLSRKEIKENLRTIQN